MLNNTTIQGRLIDNPATGQTNSGTDYANFRIAWSEKIKDKENKLYIECKAFGSTARFINQYFTKGKEIIVEGKLNTEEWTNQDGQKRSKIALIVSGVHFCGKRQDGGQAESEASQPVPEPQPVETDELPF